MARKINKDEEIHDKAIRLLEGGIVIVNGLSVKLCKCPIVEIACNICEMDCICKFGSDMANVCRECDMISKESCYLILTNPD